MTPHLDGSSHDSSPRYRPEAPRPRREPAAVRMVRMLVRRPVALLMVLAAIAVVGSIAYSRIPVQQWPAGLEVPVMWMRLSFVNPDAAVSPQEVERALARPVEEHLAGVPNVTDLRTTSRDGSLRVMLRFEEDTDMSVTYAEVRDRIDRMRAELEHELNPPHIGMVDPDSRPVAEYALTFSPELDPGEAFSRIDHEVMPVLEGLGGISNIEMSGAITGFYEIQPRADDLSRLGIGPDRLTQRLREANFARSLGTLEDSHRRYYLVADAKLNSLAELRELPIQGGVKLADVAEIVQRTSFRDDLIFLNGRAAAVLEFYKNDEANTVELCAAIERTLDELQADGRLDDFFVVKMSDDGEGISDSVRNLMETAALGGLCAFFILLLFLRRARLTLLIMVCTPLAMLIALIALYASGGSINMLSLVGFTLAVGMLVDNAVVIVENIARKRERDGDEDPESASAHGAGEVLLAVTLATLTTVVVFLPLMLLPGSAFLTFFMTAIGFTLCMAMIASLFVAIVFVPLAARHLAGSQRLSPRRLRFMRWMRTAGIPVLALAFGGSLVVSLVPGWRESLGVTNGFEGGLAVAGLALLVAAALLGLLALLWWLAPLGKPLDGFFARALERLRRAYLAVLRAALAHRIITLGVVVACVAGTVHVAQHGVEDTLEPLRIQERPSRNPDSVRLRVRLPDGMELAEARDVFAAFDATIAGIQEHDAPLAAMPDDLDPERLRWFFGERITHDAERGKLTWLGIKTEDDLDVALRLSQDSQWQRAIRDIYATSKRRVARTAMEALPEGVDAALLEEISDGRLHVRANGGSNDDSRSRDGDGNGYELIWRGRMFEEQHEALEELAPEHHAWMRAVRSLQAELQLQAVTSYMISFSARRGSIRLYFDPDDPTWDARLVGNTVAELMPTFPGVRVRYGWGRGGGGGGFGGGFGQQRLGIVLLGPETERLEALGEQIVSQLENVDGLVDPVTETEEGQPEVRLVLDREATVTQGAEPGRIARSLSFSLTGTRLPDLEMEDGTLRQLRLRMAPVTEYDGLRGQAVERMETLDEALDTRVPATPGEEPDSFTSTPLRSFVLEEPTYGTSLSRIQRLNRRTSLQITADVERGRDLAELIPEIEVVLHNVDFPAGYSYEWGERVRQWRGMDAELWTALLAAMFCVFVLMAVFFESLTKPFAILTTVPLAGIGAVWILMLTDTALDVVAIVGAVLLVGLVVNNGIVLIDLINRNVAAGLAVGDAVLDACAYRFRPILMTATTTIVGLIPMAQATGTFLGTSYYPIALTVIGGLITGTLLTLIVVPLVYTLIDDGLNGHALNRRTPTSRQALIATVATLALIAATVAAFVHAS